MQTACLPDGRLVRCSSDGTWGEPTTCPYVCLDGECAGSCTPDSVTCDEQGRVLTCDDEGQFAAGDECPELCERGQCVEECESDTFTCLGNRLVECVDGRFEDVETCAFVCDDVAGRCQGECTPNDTTCDDDLLLTCDANGEWDSGSECPHACTNDACTTQCNPDEQRCDSDTVLQTCSSEGVWEDETCEFSCSGDRCTTATECAAGTFDHDSDPSTVCQSWSTCQPGQYISVEGSPTTDRTCAACPSETYSIAQNAEECTDWTECEAGEVVDVAGSKTDDRECTPCAAGTFSSTMNADECEDCPGGMFAEEGSSDCTTWTVCDWTENETSAPSARTDTVCEPGSELRQFGTTAGDNAYDVAVDRSGNVIVVGSTSGDLAGTNAGNADVFVRKFDPRGLEVWTRQFGSDQYDTANGVDVDPAGNVYVVGDTRGALAMPNLGSSTNDAWIRKYDADGDEQWTRQYGTNNADSARHVAVDASGNAYIVGETQGHLEGTNAGNYDLYVRKYDTSGTAAGTDQAGTASADYAYCVSLDANGNNLYVSGYTQGALQGNNLGLADAYIRKYSSALTHSWTRQFGSDRADYGSSVTVAPDGTVYFVGSTDGDVDGTNAGGRDLFLRQYGSTGTNPWGRQFGSTGTDIASPGPVDSNGNFYVLGRTHADIEGTNQGGGDALIRKYDNTGAPQWTRQFGTSGTEFLTGGALDSSGRLYVVGYTDGDLAGTSAGSSDAILMRVDEP